MNMGGPGADLLRLWVVVGIVASVVIHVAFAYGVWRDASERERRGAVVEFAPGFVWVLATLLGGILIAGVYWVMHRSTLRPEYGVVKPAEYAEPLA